ncbi:sensor histidine kinase [Xylocopilactobacillus apis]|uniref:Sensor histidine kinase NatK-like C-terminal domain-containing protein n=1 Tax=Xylocopilactobacillus apis TaxID=2932183 RepID=A0AAU9D6Q3_9LACO|nr:GHKL domain-containing protein [Xylocopilactobacillus apis]BDR57100.1 hypothetical protein KIMC2_16620 [Xylocopilactobacillus apis]
MNIINYLVLGIFAIFIILTFFVIVSFVRAFNYRRDTEIKFAQNKQLKDYLDNIEQQYQELRHFKHDYKNMLLALEGFVKEGDHKQFKEYYEQLVREQPSQSELEDQSISNINYLKNEPIRGLIIEKFFYARKLGINLELEITESIEIKNHDILSIVRVIGILLDNAIEQATKEENKLVICALIKSNDQIVITVDNFVNDLEDLSQISQSGYTTKSGHSGFGLNNVDKIVKQNENLFFETEVVKQHFQATLMITGE